MVIVSPKDEEAQRLELPSYFGGEDQFPFISDRKEDHTSQSESPPPIASAAAPITFPNSGNTSTASYYAPAPAPFSHSAALTASNSGTITPLSFSRARAQGPGSTYGQFKPMFLLASSERSTSLSKGFPMAPPPSKEDPHPFVTHDINEIDWLQFLNDVCTAGSLTEKDIRRSHIPIISWVPFVGELSTYGVQKYMKSRKSSTVARTLDNWNHHYFEPRRMRIVLMRGNERLSGLRTMGKLHTPDPVNVSSGIMDQAIWNGNDRKGKGKSKEEDEVYRLFVLSI